MGSRIMGKTGKAEQSGVTYDIEDKPPIGEATALGFQHVCAMFLGNITVPLVIAGTLGLATGETTFLVQMAFIVAGSATLIQAFPIGPVGGRVPIMMGTSFAFLGPLRSVGEQFGLAAVYGAALIGSVVQLSLGSMYEHFERFFPPLVNGVVVMLIGLTLIPTGIDYAAGGVDAAHYASLTNLGLATVAFLVTLGLNQFFEGILRIASVFFGMLAGYILAVGFGMVDFGPVAQAGWVTVPVPLNFGIAFEPSAIITIGFVYLIVTMETVGNISGTVAVTGRNATSSEIRGGLICDAVMSAVGAVFNAFPNTSYAQNVGLVNFTGVASRYVVGIGGVILIGLGFIPKVGAIVTTIPEPVLGGATLVLFAMIFTSGVQIIHRDVVFTNRNMTILAVAMSLGLGVKFRPDVVANLPTTLEMLLGKGLVFGGLAALVLNIVLPETSIGGTDTTAKSDRPSPSETTDGDD